MDREQTGREWLRADLWAEWDSAETDQRRGVIAPAAQEPCPENARRVSLAGPESLTLGAMTVREALARRRSRRSFSDAPLSLEELSFLCWATQGLSEPGKADRRTAPSAGARHPLETFLLVRHVEGLDPGLYRYLPLDHQLCHLSVYEEAIRRGEGMGARWPFVREAAVLFIWAAIAYRAVWRHAFVAPKNIALDAGHVCENLYIACEALGLGTCAVAAYEQHALDALIGVDGIQAFTVYVAPVGRPKH